MAGETEHVRIRVTAEDNASATLRALRSQMEQLRSAIRRGMTSADFPLLGRGKFKTAEQAGFANKKVLRQLQLRWQGLELKDAQKAADALFAIRKRATKAEIDLAIAKQKAFERTNESIFQKLRAHKFRTEKLVPLSPSALRQRLMSSALGYPVSNIAEHRNRTAKAKRAQTRYLIRQIRDRAREENRTFSMPKARLASLGLPQTKIKYDKSVGRYIRSDARIGKEQFGPANPLLMQRVFAGNAVMSRLLQGIYTSQNQHGAAITSRLVGVRDAVLSSSARLGAAYRRFQSPYLGSPFFYSMLGTGIAAGLLRSTFSQFMDEEFAEYRLAVYGFDGEAGAGANAREAREKFGERVAMKYGIPLVDSMETLTETLKAGIPIDDGIADRIAESVARATFVFDGLNVDDTTKLLARVMQFRRARTGTWDVDGMENELNDIAIAVARTAADATEIVSGLRRGIGAGVSTNMSMGELATFLGAAITGGTTLNTGRFVAFLTNELAAAGVMRGQRRDDLNKGLRMIRMPTGRTFANMFVNDATPTLLEILKRINDLPAGRRAEAAYLIGMRQWRSQLLTLASMWQVLDDVFEEQAKDRSRPEQDRFFNNIVEMRMNLARTHGERIRVGTQLMFGAFGMGMSDAFKEFATGFAANAAAFRRFRFQDISRAIIDGIVKGFGFDTVADIVKRIFPSGTDNIFSDLDIEKIVNFFQGFVEGFRAVAGWFWNAFTWVAELLGFDTLDAKTIGQLVGGFIALTFALHLLSPVVSTIGAFSQVIVAIANSVSALAVIGTAWTFLGTFQRGLDLRKIIGRGIGGGLLGILISIFGETAANFIARQLGFIEDDATLDFGVTPFGLIPGAGWIQDWLNSWGNTPREGERRNWWHNNKRNDTEEETSNKQSSLLGFIVRGMVSLVRSEQLLADIPAEMGKEVAHQLKTDGFWIPGTERTTRSYIDGLSRSGGSHSYSIAPSSAGMAALAGPAAKLSGSVATRSQEIFKMLKADGWSDEQSAALVGHMIKESSLNPSAYNAGEGAFGLLQWRKNRLANLKKFAASKGLDYRSIEAQSQFIRHEMANDPYERRKSAGFRSATSLEGASAALESYIRFGDKSGSQRLANARSVMAGVSGGSTSVGSLASGKIPVKMTDGSTRWIDPRQPVGQAFAGGSTHEGVLAVAQKLAATNVAGELNRFTGFNDLYHAGTRSLHAKGLAGDFTIKDPRQSAAAAKQLREKLQAIGLVDGRDFRIIDEYINPSAHATGGHIHYEFRSPKAAEIAANAFRGEGIAASIPLPPRWQGERQTQSVAAGGGQISINVYGAGQSPEVIASTIERRLNHELASRTHDYNDELF